MKKCKLSIFKVIYEVIMEKNLDFEFEDLILDYDRDDWKEYGEIIYLFLNGEKDIMIHVEQKNIGVLFPVF